MIITEIANNQQLLFRFAPKVRDQVITDFTIPESFYENGYITFENIESPEAVYEFMEKFLASLNLGRSPLFKRLLPRTKLAKIDRIPVCKPVVDCVFQALHLDMGQPLLEDILPQMIFNFTVLYFPTNQSASQAQTRVASIKKLLQQKKWGDRRSVENRLINYTRQHGDGWESTNTGRLACFARFIDAMSEQEELINFRDQHTNQWFEVNDDTTGLQSRKVEKEFFDKHGYDIDAVEKQIQLQPGRLLIINNLEAIHGKIGKRKEAEIYQFMYGIEEATPEDIKSYRRYIVGELASS